jgi:hypothetical protein
MGERSLAERIGQPVARARQLLDLHRQTYPTYWTWSQSAVDQAMLLGELHTVFGWQVHTGPDAKCKACTKAYRRPEPGARLTALLSTVDACIPNPFLTEKRREPNE